MKKFDVLFIVLILAMPVFAANSNMVSDFGATSVAPALNDITWGTSVSYAQEGRSILVDVPFASPSIAAYAADFSAATADVAPNYAYLTRTDEIGKDDAATSFLDATYDELYYTTLYTSGSNAVLVTVNKTDGSLVAMKTLQFTGSTYNGILALGSGNYLVYGYSNSYWGGTYRGFALTVSVSGDTYVINNRNLFWGFNDVPYYPIYDAAYDPASGYAVFCGMLSLTSQLLQCVSLDVATLSTGDAVRWDLPDPVSNLGDLKVNALEMPASDTQFFVSTTANSPGQVYVISFDLNSSGDFQANNWVVNSTIPGGYTSYIAIKDSILDANNNLVLSLTALDGSTFNHGVVVSLNPATGATVYAKVAPASQISNGLCTVGSYTGIAMDASSTALAYVLNAAGTTLMASQTPGTAVADNTNAVSCAEVVTEGGNSFMALGGRYKTGSDNYETLMLVNGITGDFVERFYMTYPAGTYPTTTYKIFGTNDGKIQYFSNQGVGGQDFDLEDSSGPVPEFSIATLLLAVLLAGGLVVFVVRRRK